MRRLQHAVPAVGKGNGLGKQLLKNRYLYILMIPSIVFYLVFCYWPMYGLILAFKQYNAGLGILKSPFVGLYNFRSLFSDSYFWYVLLNTLKISFGRLIIEFPFPILLAVLFNELRGNKTKKILQTVYTFPHFLSWVILSGIVINFLDYNGPINFLINRFGGERQIFLGNKELFVPLLYITNIWKEAGWSSIVYLAAIAGISMELYEAADLDGANRFQKIWHITLPSIRGTILMLLTLQVGTVLNMGFDQIFNLINPVVQPAGDVLDTYIYRITFKTGNDFAFSTTVSLFKSVINFTLLITVDYISKRMEGVGILSTGK